MKLMWLCGCEKKVICLTTICLLSTLINADGIQRTATSSYLTARCFGDLGCFSKLPPFFDLIHRPISVLPQMIIDTKFALYKTSNLADFTLLDATIESLRNSAFNASLETKVIIHGFQLKTSDPQFVEFQDLIYALMNNANYNVIFVNWTQSNGDSNDLSYPQAVANARVVGAQLAKLIQFLSKDKGVQLETVHLIGHSLGAHVAGWAGERLQKAGRISALDPAGPYFHHAPDIARLDKSDALFVDAIHTNAGTELLNGLGTTQPLGDLDFYPNGGLIQPGCSQNNGLLSSNMRSDSCSHLRVVTLYTESINQESCTFRGLECNSWQDYQAGNCDNKMSIVMGFHASKQERITKDRKIYLVTNDKPPYCIGN